VSSWEIGTQATALLELEWPSLFVYRQDSIPPPRTIDNPTASDVFKIVDHVVAKRAAGNWGLPFFKDNAIGDPASK
jgi:hypothetical protein